MGASIKFNAGQPSVNGFVYPLIIEVTGPASYAAGGFSVAAAALGLTAVDQVGVLSCSGALLAEYIKSTGKVKLSYPTGGAGTSPSTVTTAPVGAAAAVPASGLTATVGGTATATPAASSTPVTSTGAQPAIPVDLASVTVTLGGSGTSAAPGLVPGVGKELPDAANASTITVTLLVMGRV